MLYSKRENRKNTVYTSASLERERNKPEFDMWKSSFCCLYNRADLSRGMHLTKLRACTISHRMHSKCLARFTANGFHWVKFEKKNVNFPLQINWSIKKMLRTEKILKRSWLRQIIWINRTHVSGFIQKHVLYFFQWMSEEEKTEPSMKVLTKFFSALVSLVFVLAIHENYTILRSKFWF